jgi:hypothetical protein
MASIFRRIYDWLLRLFWYVSPALHQLAFLSTPRALGMRHLLPPMITFLSTKKQDAPGDTYFDC